MVVFQDDVLGAGNFSAKLHLAVLDTRRLAAADHPATAAGRGVRVSADAGGGGASGASTTNDGDGGGADGGGGGGGGGGSDRWVLKLFVTDYWDGWGLEPRHVAELGLGAGLGAGLGWASAAALSGPVILGLCGIGIYRGSSNGALTAHRGRHRPLQAHLLWQGNRTAARLSQFVRQLLCPRCSG